MKKPVMLLCALLGIATLLFAQTLQTISPFTTSLAEATKFRLTAGAAKPTITSGTLAPSASEPIGSLYALNQAVSLFCPSGCGTVYYRADDGTGGVAWYPLPQGGVFPNHATLGSGSVVLASSLLGGSSSVVTASALTGTGTTVALSADASLINPTITTGVANFLQLGGSTADYFSFIRKWDGTVTGTALANSCDNYFNVSVSGLGFTAIAGDRVFGNPNAADLPSGIVFTGYRIPTTGSNTVRVQVCNITSGNIALNESVAGWLLRR